MKRQKEQKRLARAQEKREARLARKRGQVAGDDETGSVVDSAEIESLGLAEAEAPQPDEEPQSEQK